MEKDKKNQHKPGVRSDEKMDEDFNKKAPDPNDPDFQKNAPEMDFPNIGDFQKKPIDDTIIGDINHNDHDEREDETTNKEA